MQLERSGNTMAKKSQISEGSDGDDESQSDRKQRLMDKYRLDLKYMNGKNARLIFKFLSSHPDEITTHFHVRFSYFSETICDSYTLYLAPLLRILKKHKILDIIDKKRRYVLQLISHLRLCFKGSWIDSLESLLVDNISNDSASRRELRNMKRDVLDEIKASRYKVKDFRRALKDELPSYILECTRRVLKNEFPGEEDIDTIPVSEIIPAAIKCYRRRLKLAKAELPTVIEKRKAVKDARKSLKFFYQV